ncbi:hypothetical protein [Chloroflexus sp.]|uniref:hypothetical protein n=1 Tax=Chloroflexus sp. TaxID=1904827 RepID=UPI00258EA578|nr:hypothetical protein [Chloroflexus sp.]
MLVTAGGPATLTNTATLSYTDSAGQPRPPVTASDETASLVHSRASYEAGYHRCDGNNDGLAGAGDVIEYTLILTNTGPEVALQLVVADTPDVNTTLITGSVTATPPAIGCSRE